MQLYANPYDTSASGFSFDSAEQFDEEYQKRLPVEEYEIDFIDGTAEEAALFKVADITAANLSDWFDGIDSLKDYEFPSVYFLLSNGNVSSFSEAVEKADQQNVTEGDTLKYVEDYVEQMGGPAELGKETLENYFDYESFANDMNMNGDVVEFEFAGTTYSTDPNQT